MASTISTAPAMKLFNRKSYVGVKPADRCPGCVAIVRASERQDGPPKLGMSDAECEGAVVAGNVPEAPPVPPKPAAPAGTLVVPSLPLNSARSRRNQKSPAMRASFQETSISPANFVYSLFIHEGEEDTPIGAMPGCYRLGWRHGLVKDDFVTAVYPIKMTARIEAMTSMVPDGLKSPTGDEAYNDNGLVPRTIRLLKDKFLDLVIYTDVALDPYSSDGHDGIVREDGEARSSLFGYYKAAQR